MRTSPDLPPKLEAVLIRLGRDRRLNLTQAVKLPYLVDVVARHLLGEPITEGTHQAWEMGVVTREAWHYLKKRQDSPTFHLEDVPTSDEKRLVVDAEGEDVLTPDERAVVDAVADEFAGFQAGELGRLTKLMNPDIRAWGPTNRPASLGEDAYERLSEDYQGMAEDAASVTLDRLRRDSVPVEDIRDAIA
jgi:uncharacterized phage-associated protein